VAHEQIKPGHLFICYTPLHALLAKRVIKEERIPSYVLVFYYHLDSEKIRHYFNEIAGGAAKAYYVKKNNSFLHTARTLVLLSYSLKRQLSSSPVVYTGNVKSLYSRFLIFRLKSDVLHTFDDGIGNVSGEGYFYKDLIPGFTSKVAGFFGLDFSYSRLYKQIKQHYTIYKMPNVMPHCEYIDLFNFESEGVIGNENTTVSVLLTSTMCEDGFISLEDEKRLYKTVIGHFGVKYVIAHPLEMHDKCEGTGVTILRSHKIAEDIVMDLKKQYRHIRVIGWYSSALIHLVNVRNIEAINIDFDSSLSLDKTRKFFESQQVKTYKPDFIITLA